jgi:uncharacterized delta-60 repeat protein
MLPSRHRTARLGMERLEARDNPSGGLDNSFSGDGRAMYDQSNVINQATAMAIQADGKIVTVGATGASSNFFVTRSLPNGTLDTTFSGDGKFSHTFGGIDVATDVAVQADGKIVVVGWTDFTTTDDFAVLRLNADGTLDSTFGTGGTLTIHMFGADRATGVAVQPDNKILIGGYTNKGDDFAVARLTAAGVLDTTFGGDGRQMVNFGGNDVCNDLALQSDNKIVLVGTTGTDMAVARLTAAGALDATFSGDGLQTIDFTATETGSGVALQPDNKIVVVGSTSKDNDMAVARLTAAGALDPTFDADGMVRIDFGGTETGLAATVRAGKIVVAGGTISGPFATNPAVARLTAAGALDPAFDADGKVTVNFGGIGRFNAVTTDKQGKVVAAGFAANGVNDDVAVARLFNSDAAIVGRASASGQWSIASSTGSSFVTTTFGTWGTALGWQDVRAGDFTGDGVTDVAGRNSNGEWWVGVNTGSGFTSSKWVDWSTTAQWRDVTVGDFNGDGRADIAGRAFDGGWWLARSLGNSFINVQITGWNESAGWRDTQVADFTGDGLPDIASRTAGGYWWVARTVVNGGSVTATNAQWGNNWNEAANWKDVRAGDFNGDGKADIAGRASYDGSWWVASSSGTTFTHSQWGVWNEAAGWKDVRVGDFNGDGKSDIAGRTSTGQWWMATSTGAGSTNALWTNWNEAGNWRDVCVGDFNGDGKADIAGRTSTGQWWVNVNSGTAFTYSLWDTWNEGLNWQSVTAGAFRG